MVFHISAQHRQNFRCWCVLEHARSVSYGRNRFVNENTAHIWARALGGLARLETYLHIREHIFSFPRISRLSLKLKTHHSLLEGHQTLAISLSLMQEVWRCSLNSIQSYISYQSISLYVLLSQLNTIIHKLKDKRWVLIACSWKPLESRTRISTCTCLRMILM